MLHVTANSMCSHYHIFSFPLAYWAVHKWRHHFRRVSTVFTQDHSCIESIHTLYSQYMEVHTLSLTNLCSPAESPQSPELQIRRQFCSPCLAPWDTAEDVCKLHHETRKQNFSENWYFSSEDLHICGVLSSPPHRTLKITEEENQMFIITVRWSRNWSGLR